MTDEFESHVSGLEAPATDIFAITPDDDNDLAKTTRVIAIGTSGDIAVVTKDNTEITIPQAIVDAFNGVLPLRVKRVKVTGTGASGIYGLV